ncbi:MAG: hypothetical protein RL110_631 [Bacteroidota bacterium]|jgi:gliding motility-associated lipoprotein GldD
MDQSTIVMSRVNSLIFGGILCLVLLSSCSYFLDGDKDKPLVPKPPCFLRTNLPAHQYFKYSVKNDLVSYSFDLSKHYAMVANESNGKTSFQKFDLGPLNGSLYFYAIRFDRQDSLNKLINRANAEVDQHKIKADRIDFKQFINRDNKVYGTFFQLKGDVATNYQFYLTDSSARFVRGEVLMNCRPNYDSLRPTLDYLGLDMERMLQSFRWKD